MTMTLVDTDSKAWHSRERQPACLPRTRPVDLWARGNGYGICLDVARRRRLVEAGTLSDDSLGKPLAS